MHAQSCLTLATPWTAKASLSLGFSRQEYWSALPFPSAGDLPHPGTEPSPPALTGRFFASEPPEKPLSFVTHNLKAERLRASSGVNLLRLNTALCHELHELKQITQFFLGLSFIIHKRGKNCKYHL